MNQEDKKMMEPKDSFCMKFSASQMLPSCYTVSYDVAQYCTLLYNSFPTGHDAALGKALEMARELRKMGEERALVLYKAHLKLNTFASNYFSCRCCQLFPAV